MRLRKRWWLGLPLLAAGTGLLLVPGTGALVYCAALPLSGYVQLPDGSFASPVRSTAERAALSELTVAARARIAETYGPHRADPRIVFFEPSRLSAALGLNGTGSTSFIPGGACVLIGPAGRNVDVVAHELMHAEILDRAGYWARLWQLPVWLDEGLAMQVDRREHYAWTGQNEAGGSAFVRGLDSARQFFSTDADQLTRNYAAAKRETCDWLQQQPDGVYPLLQQLRNGEPASGLPLRR
jgi:hypothetical protein